MMNRQWLNLPKSSVGLAERGPRPILKYHFIILIAMYALSGIGYPGNDAKATSMETGTTMKRPRGRPRTDASPRSDVHARLPPALKARLERDAKRAHRSVAKEFEVRLERSYLNDEMYGGVQMSAMFREMAEVASGYAKYKNRGSFFEDFEIFVFVRDVWQTIIQRQMPRPGEELLAEACREWDAFKAGSLQTATQQAARDWLIHHTPMTMTLVQALAGSHEPPISGSVGREPPDDKPSNPEAAAIGEPALQPKPIFSGGTAPPIGSLGKALESLIPSESVTSRAFSGSAVWPIGSIAKAMEGLLPSQGNARAAAGEVSRLAQLLADATEEQAAGDTAVQPTRPDSSFVTDRQ
jgi:hypothetical protein